MAPQQHLAWFEDNIDWFETIPVDALPAPVPACPGWSVTDVVNHLSFGLGLGYRVAVSLPPDTPTGRAFDDVEWPSAHPVGQAAVHAFSSNMRRCLQTFEELGPDEACWTYAGPGTAGFWFRRAAIETTLHRFDVEEAVRDEAAPLPADRSTEAIAETVEFALPLAATMAGHPAGRLMVSCPDLALEFQVGESGRDATIVGTAHDTLRGLWGRDRDRLRVTGNAETADGWLSLVETAFAGR